MSTRAPINGWELYINSASSAALGTSVTPGNNTYGAYAQVLSGASVTDDIYGIKININSMAVSGSARDAIATVGLDPAGGTSYTDTIIDLLCGAAGTITGVGCGGVWYDFPLFIKKNTSIAIKASVNNATVGTCNAFVQLRGAPTGPIIPRTGTFVRTFGTTPGSSTGTAITANGAGSKSAYVQLGSATVEPLWYWCLGIGINNNNMSNNPSSWDLAVGSSTTVNRLVVNDQLVIANTSEVLAYASNGAYSFTESGAGVFARGGGPATVSTGMSAAAYGMGG